MFHARLFMFAFFFCCLIGSIARAQESARSTVSLTSPSETITDEVPRLPWSVGMDLLPLINKNYLPGIFAKYYVQPENRLPGAIRLRVASRFHLTEYEQPQQSPSTNEGRYLGIIIRPGYEWQRQMGKHQVFYGIDAHFEYDHSYNGDNLNTTWTTKNTWGIGAVGIIGYQYFISPHVSFSTEAAYELIFDRQKIETYNTPTDFPEVPNHTFDHNSRLEGNFRPLYVVNFHFHFQHKPL